MSSTVVTLPDGFQYVGAGLLSTVFILMYQSMLVNKHRKLSGIKYPQLYAEKAEAAASKDALLFNCAQRAHQNTLENVPIVYVTTLLVGAKFPAYAASAVALWSLSRIFYTRGYLSGDPAKRVSVMYGVGTISLLGLLFGSTYVTGEWLYKAFSAKFL
ncbi:hypothetical protein B0H34DRAFT_682746 [Crassisporium funariophilum]|nr:hypothetical protein B0H34DRAFT_682746 [Crassisporium funariophilum]